MQNDIAIDIRNLTKRYVLYKSPFERLKNILFRSENGEVFSALDGITLSVKRGESLGIIGENGAGKSTILKLISGVLTPSEGVIEINGRVLSILELGVGLHPEFTGRENIFFYGDILGLNRDFLKSKVDEIIQFSELDSFIDLPIKTYSSGMLMRLMFSIVTSFSPEILILDEVLAVGDLHFQHKSLNKILDYKKNGATILFCSHDTYHIRMLCDRVLWLKNGRVEAMGEPENVVAQYEAYQFDKEVRNETTVIKTALEAYINDVRLTSDFPIRKFDDLTFEIQTSAKDSFPYHLLIALRTIQGGKRVGIFASGTHIHGQITLQGNRRIQVTFYNIPLMGANFYANVKLLDVHGLICYHEKDSAHFDIHKEKLDIGVCYLKNSWKIIG